LLLLLMALDLGGAAAVDAAACCPCGTLLSLLPLLLLGGLEVVAPAASPLDPVAPPSLLALCLPAAALLSPLLLLLVLLPVLPLLLLGSLPVPGLFIHSETSQSSPPSSQQFVGGRG
jgi:hypothetical protein